MRPPTTPLMSQRSHNFSAGPAVLPEPVLERIANELYDWAGTGVSVMEASHRSEAFIACAAEAEARVRRLLSVPEDYAVLFLQGGASLQFSATVMNLAPSGSLAFAETGAWSAKAYDAASKLAPVVRACTLERDAHGRSSIPSVADWAVSEDASYLHLCDNETISGVAWDDALLDDVQDRHPHLPLVADMSSSIMSRPVDVSRFQVIYAGAQKNMGPAGVTLVIASPDAIARSRAAASQIPNVLCWAAMADADSMLNTPPVFAWYVCGLVFEWVEAQGGVAAMQQRNRAQAARVYEAIDAHPACDNSVAERFRSIMNVPFVFRDERETAEFLAACQSQGLVGLKGHKSVGGCRASLYNALPDSAVDALLQQLRASAAKAAAADLGAA